MASPERWNSATTLYLANRLTEEAAKRRRSLMVLDLGCGDGTAIRLLQAEGHELYGYDLPHRSKALERSLRPLFGHRFTERIRISTDGTAPFRDARFDVVYANQVLEHVDDLDSVLAEAARVLKPTGAFYALLPLMSTIIEPHAGVVGAHWLPSGEFRRKYLAACYSLQRLITGRPERPLERAKERDTYIRRCTCYRTLGSMIALGKTHFQRIKIETDLLLRAKLEMWTAGSGIPRILVRVLRSRPVEKSLAQILTRFFNVALRLRSPRRG